MESPQPHADPSVHRVPDDAVEIIDARRESPQHPPRPVYEIRQRKKLALGLFLATVVCTWLSGLFLFGTVVDGAIYSAAVLAILGFHEMGHYLQARRYHVPASLPYFIPMPPQLNPFGTMGAVILQGPGANRKSLFDIAVSGPLAGLVLALPITWIGVQQSVIMPAPPPTPERPVFRVAEPLVMKWMITAKHGEIPEGYDVELNPLAWAGWVGLFITALNLIPIGQLDGGHILYALLRRKAHPVAMFLLFGSFVYMALSGNFTYVAMALLIGYMGARHPPTANDDMPLGTPRILLGWLTLAFIVLGFTIAPFPDLL